MPKKAIGEPMTSTILYLPKDFYRRVQAYAQYNRRTFNAQVRVILEEFILHAEEKAGIAVCSGNAGITTFPTTSVPPNDYIADFSDNYVVGHPKGHPDGSHPAKSSPAVEGGE
jgi:hypothetical protein